MMALPKYNNQIQAIMQVLITVNQSGLSFGSTQRVGPEIGSDTW